MRWDHKGEAQAVTGLGPPATLSSSWKAFSSACADSMRPGLVPTWNSQGTTPALNRRQAGLTHQHECAEGGVEHEEQTPHQLQDDGSQERVRVHRLHAASVGPGEWHLYWPAYTAHRLQLSMRSAVPGRPRWLLCALPAKGRAQTACTQCMTAAALPDSRFSGGAGPPHQHAHLGDRQPGARQPLHLGEEGIHLRPSQRRVQRFLAGHLLLGDTWHRPPAAVPLHAPQSPTAPALCPRPPSPHTPWAPSLPSWGLPAEQLNSSAAVREHRASVRSHVRSWVPGNTGASGPGLGGSPRPPLRLRAPGRTVTTSNDCSFWMPLLRKIKENSSLQGRRVAVQRRLGGPRTACSLVCRLRFPLQRRQGLT